jgi:hypothetical protein
MRSTSPPAPRSWGGRRSSRPPSRGRPATATARP